jgi:hypothetical protein
MKKNRTTMKSVLYGNYEFLLLAAVCFILSLVVGSGMPAYAKGSTNPRGSKIAAVAADTVITDSANEEKDQPEVVITKNKKKSKSVTQSQKAAKDAGAAIDEEDENDMYVPYEKWRVDKFDNWGIHKKSKSSGVKSKTDEPDTTGNTDSKKGFNDKDKEL